MESIVYWPVAVYIIFIFICTVYNRSMLYLAIYPKERLWSGRLTPLIQYINSLAGVNIIKDEEECTHTEDESSDDDNFTSSGYEENWELELDDVEL